MSNLADFKQAYGRFIKALRYIVENEPKLKADEKRWDKIKKNFELKFEKVLDESWLALSQEERKKMAPIYLHRRMQSDPAVKKVLEVFNAKIKSVEENEITMQALQ